LYEISQENEMDHGEALQMMAAERYLLNELSPEQKDAFEEHVFECQECALDLRAGAAFINEAKNQLPGIASQHAPSATAETGHLQRRGNKKRWFFLWQPAFAVPVFAAMLAVIAYQNFSIIPSLRRSATEPRILQSNAIHAGTRGDAHTAVVADRSQGLSLSIELPQSSVYSSFSFELHDANGKQLWTQSLSASTLDVPSGRVVTLVIPGSGLKSTSYSLAIFGVTSQNNRIQIDRRILDVQLQN
jgi:anti-sigma factor RsiW